MLYRALHNPFLRLIAAVLGELLIAVGTNLFIVPLNLYSGGAIGFCQLLRTLMETYGGMSFGTLDIAGVLYFLINIPILWVGYKILGRGLALRTIICAVTFSFFYSITPIPAAPVVEDYLTSCLLGGIITGLGGGIVLTCSCSSGGLDVIGLCLNKKGSSITVGRFSLFFNVFLYAACLILFDPEVAIYSIIYNFFTVMVMDRMHQQNVNVQVLLFTKVNGQELGRLLIQELGRGVTFWNGTGAYTGTDVNIMCVYLSKYEIEDLVRIVHTMDPTAFLTVQEGPRIYGNFTKKIG